MTVVVIVADNKVIGLLYKEGVKVCTFLCLPIHVPHPLAGAPEYNVSLTHVLRLCAVGCRLKDRLMRQLSLGVGFQVDPQVNRRDYRKIMDSIMRRVAAGLAAAMRYKAANQAEVLCASGQCAAAAVALKLAVDLGHLPSRALKAWMLIGGREGVAKDLNGAFELVEEGTRLGCHHCQGVMAWCYRHGWGIRPDAALSLELARYSSRKGSRYGQYVLGLIYQYGRGGVAQDDTQAVVFYRLAAAQGLDEAQCKLAYMYHYGEGIVQDHPEAWRFYRLAAAQGYPAALYNVARCHECGQGVPANKAEAIRLYRRALAAGYHVSAIALQRLSAE